MLDYVNYKIRKQTFSRLIGLSCLHIYERDETVDYANLILNYFVNYFVPLDQSVEDNIKDFIEIYDRGHEQIATKHFLDLIEEYNIDRSTIEGWDNKIFVMVWENLMTTIYIELLYNYASLFTEVPHDCHCNCSITNGEYSLPESKPLGSAYIKTTSGGCGCNK